MDYQTDYQMEELLPIVAEATQKYTGCDSTSVTYEKAQMLMEGVMYCLEEYGRSVKYGLAGKAFSVREQYHAGMELVLEKASKIREIYNGMAWYFDDYGVEVLRDTIKKGIPEFLKWYDAKFCPQNTIVTLDYPLLKSICTLKGVDAIYEYICSVKMEQKFLEKFQREYVITVLKAAVPDYKRGMENICSILLMNTVGHLAVGKPLSDRGFTKEEYTKLEKIFSGNSVGGTEDILRHVIEEMIAQVYENDEELLAYLQCGRKNMAVRIETAIRNGYLEKLFVR